jgi:hypothetical protein
VTIGSEFLWSDFACYIAGCGIGVIGEVIAHAAYRRERQASNE